MQSYGVEKKWSIMRGIWKAEGVDTSAFLPMQQRSAPVRQNTSMNSGQSFTATTDLSSTYETPGGDQSQQADDVTKEIVNQLEETEDLGRQLLDLSLALDSSEMVSEALLPIYNHLLTLRKCLMEVKASGGVSSPRELYPYSMKLDSIDNLRRNGKFMVGDDIPRGQSSLLQLLETCFDLLHDLRKDPRDDTSADAVRLEDTATSPREQTADAAPTETASKHPAGPDGNPRSEPDVDVRVGATSVPSTPTYWKEFSYSENVGVQVHPHKDLIPENRLRFANSASNRIRLSLIWDATWLTVGLDLDARCEAFFRAFQQLCVKRKGEFDRSRTFILLKPDKHAPEDEAYALSLDEDEMNADWETTVAWIKEHRRDKSPHLYGEVRVEEG
jgi:hypothetical protein